MDSLIYINLTWDPANPGGQPTAAGMYLVATATFTGLPANNSDFGLKQATIHLGCGQSKSSDFEVFFPKNATNHPGGQADSPNWFYYWENGQVCGINTNCVYEATSGYGYTRPGIDPIIRVGALAADENIGPETLYSGTTIYGTIIVGGTGKGIKCVAETIQHEQHHLYIYDQFNARIATAHANGGKYNGDPDDDPDGDSIPNIEESTFCGITTNPNNPNTFNVVGYPTYGDEEVRCLKEELNLNISYFPDLDWANPGCQSKNVFGP